MFKRKCKITFISHGATVYSQEGIINDKLKYPKLNDIGIEETEKVCEYLKKRGVAYDRIYSSPNTCCTQTAQIIAKLFKQKYTAIELIARNHGAWQGTSYFELFKEFGSDALTYTPENGESIIDFNNRISEFLDKLVEENKGNRIIVVTTPEVIQSALAKTLGLQPESQHKLLIKTGSLTQISYFDDWSSVIYSNFNFS